jgi:hypothetical protein
VVLGAPAKWRMPAGSTMPCPGCTTRVWSAWMGIRLGSIPSRGMLTYAVPRSTVWVRSPCCSRPASAHRHGRQASPMFPAPRSAPTQTSR